MNPNSSTASARPSASAASPIAPGKSYTATIRRFIPFHGNRHPADLGPQAIVPFLSHLAEERNVAPATQNAALCALVFLHENVLQIPVGDLGDFPRAKRQRRLPVVLAKDEVKRLFAHLTGQPLLMARLLFALESKYPKAGKQWPWFRVFPASDISTDPRSKLVRRHHESDFTVQRPVKAAIIAAGIAKPASCHNHRHAFATISWKTTTTRAPCRSCSATATSPPPRSTLMSRTDPASASAARWTFDHRGAGA